MTRPKLLAVSLRLLMVGLVAALLLGGVGPGVHDDPAATAAPVPGPVRQKYVIQNSVSKQSFPGDQALKLNFLEEIQKRYGDLTVEIENRVFLETEKCKGIQNCDLVTINVDERQLVIRCTEKPRGFEKFPDPPAPCGSARKEICLQALANQLPQRLWSHDEIHRNKNRR